MAGLFLFKIKCYNQMVRDKLHRSKYFNFSLDPLIPRLAGEAGLKAKTKTN